MRFRPPEPSFSGISSTKSGFLCSFTKLDVGVGGLSRRKRHRCTCVAYTTADATAVAPAQPSHLRSRCTCAADTTAVAPAQPLCRRSRRICVAAVPSAVACSRLPPVPPVLPLLPPLHLLSRFTCGAAAPAQTILPQPTTVAPDGACGLGYHSGLGGGVEDVVD